MNGLLGNPWLLAVLFALGVASGGSGSWYVQGQRLAATQARFDGFVTTTRVAGEAAAKESVATALADAKLKETSDHEYKITLDVLRADNLRLRNARSGGSIVPAAPASTRRPDLACFDRPELERALQQLDAEVSGLLDEGDTSAIGLNAARVWLGDLHFVQ